MLVDSHCHLDYPALSKDRDGVLSRAKAAGVARLINISTTMKDFPAVRATAEAHDEVFCSFGIHPHHVSEEGESLTTEAILELADHPKVVGIGETGLDYFYEHGSKEDQEKSFRAHLRACVAMDLPVIIHSRDAEEDTARILREELAGGKLRGVMHCFSSKRVLATDALDLGFYISLSGILTFKKSEDLRSIARDVPLNRLLVETDSPFLAPEPFRGKICEPAYVASTARVLAGLKDVSEAEIAQHTTENFFRLFSKVRRP
jgi:TatD DNase family protein